MSFVFIVPSLFNSPLHQVSHLHTMASRKVILSRLSIYIVLGVQFENSSEIGVFSTLTNSYCLLALTGHGGDSEYVKDFYHELEDHIPIVRGTVAGCRIVGRLTVGLVSLSLQSNADKSRKP